MVACADHPHFPIDNIFPGYEERWSLEEDGSDTYRSKSLRLIADNMYIILDIA
jgi:hypothetical protein